jgi:geranylgeranyl pyrophosphate synthase
MMNIYKPAVNYILKLPLLKAWAGAIPLLERAASKQPRDWRLPLLTCKAVGGTIKQATPAAASIGCALIGILLIDDMLDDDPRGEFHRIGQAQAANYSSVFLAASSQAILQSQADPAVKLMAVRSLNEMIISVSFGQYLDVQNPSSEAAYWQVVQMKSASFFQSVFELGALLGNGPAQVVTEIGRAGRIYGEMIQIHDDLNDTMQVPANPDWVQSRSPLPILFARLVDHPGRARFEKIRPLAAGNPKVLKEAQEILIQSGAVSYCIHELFKRHQIVSEMLSRLPLARGRRKLLMSLFDNMVKPAYKLFQEIAPPSVDQTKFSKK